MIYISTDVNQPSSAIVPGDGSLALVEILILKELFHKLLIINFLIKIIEFYFFYREKHF